ncbi:MAG: hypothetical protein ACKVXR_16590 [Planctomycetota bacterium]
MKIHAHHRRGNSGRGRFTRALAGLAVILFATLPASGGAGTPGGNGPGGHVSGDETIGTLPVMGGGRINLPFTRGWRGISPAFSLEGSAADLSLVIQSARGRGFVSRESIDARTGRIRLAFHGDVLVAIDRELAASLPVDLGIAVPASFGEGRMVLTWGDRPARSARLGPGILQLPLGSMSTPESLDQAPALIRTGNSAGVRTTHTLAVTGDLLILGQRD